jgi:hypothetical protein
MGKENATGDNGSFTYLLISLEDVLVTREIVQVWYDTYQAAFCDRVLVDPACWHVLHRRPMWNQMTAARQRIWTTLVAMTFSAVA